MPFYAYLSLHQSIVIVNTAVNIIMIVVIVCPTPRHVPYHNTSGKLATFSSTNSGGGKGSEN